MRTDVAIIGAGQAGLAMSHCLAAQGIEHVVFERGRIAERWRSERWDSLRLLTPNWMSRLPGWSYRGEDPGGFMSMPEVIAHLESYARAGAMPVQEATVVRALQRLPGFYRLDTSRGDWRARAVVIATGQCERPLVPAMAARLPGWLHQVTPSSYRHPGQLPAGGVLVVGASASGVQLAEEIHCSGRPVTLAVGRHTRLPRRYRGRDIFAWMERAGVLDDPAAGVQDLAAARRQPSLQLVGRAAPLDLGTLRALGVRLTGRLLDVEGGVLRCAEDLPASTAEADRRLQRLLARLDPVADAEGAPRGEAPAPLAGLTGAPTRLDLAAEGIATVLWATGFRRDFRWLEVPGVLDAAGEIIHQGGVTPAPGLFALGLRFLRRRNSNFIDGVGADAAALTAEILRHLHPSGRAAA